MPGHPVPGSQSIAGFIVLGLLVFIVALMCVSVLVGKLIYAPHRVYHSPTQPVLRYVAAEGSVVSRGRVVGQLARSDSVWAVVLQNGTVVVYQDGASRRVVGVSSVLLDP